MSIFLYVVIAILQTHASLISEDLSQVISSIFSMSPSPATIEIEIFNVSCNFVRWCARFHYRQLQRIRWCSTSCVFFFFLLLFFCFFTGSQNERVCHKESRPSLNAAWRGNYRLITHTSRFPFFSRTLSGLGQQQSEWKSNSKFKKREPKQRGEV